MRSARGRSELSGAKERKKQPWLGQGWQGPSKALDPEPGFGPHSECDGQPGWVREGVPRGKEGFGLCSYKMAWRRACSGP